MNNKLYVSNLSTNSLSSSELRQIASVEKDMWAYWIWEYIKCEWCWKIHSKKDIFWHLGSSINNKSVDYLENKYLWDSISCNHCNSKDTKFIYEIDSNIENIIDRYKNTVSSYLTVLHDKDFKIKWFCDWYVDNFSSIYRRELSPHYNKELFTVLDKNIKKDYLVDIYNNLFFSLSSLWTFQKYSSILNLIKLLNSFSFSVEDDFIELPSITEFDKWSPVQKFSKLLWIKLLDIPKSIKYNFHSNYNSNLYYLEWSIKKWREVFSQRAMEIVKKSLIK